MYCVSVRGSILTKPVSDEEMAYIEELDSTFFDERFRVGTTNVMAIDIEGCGPYDEAAVLDFLEQISPYVRFGSVHFSDCNEEHWIFVFENGSFSEHDMIAR